MTRTEDRLRDYLAAVADSVRPGDTAPLAPPRPRRRPRRARAAFRHRGWQTWGVPLAAAASVLAVASLAVAVAGLAAGHGPAPTSGTGNPAGLPRYYAEVDGSAAGGSVVVRSSSSGAVIASVDKADLLRESALPAQPDGVLMAVAAAPGDRTFYAEMLTGNNQEWVFTFAVNGPGPVTGIARIRGGVVRGGYSSGLFGLTVSPDGQRIALTATSGAATVEGGHVFAVQDEIVVIDPRAGTQHAWHGGLYRPGTSFDIQSLSWSGDGQSLVFVPAWCGPVKAYDMCYPYSAGNASTQVRGLRVDDGGTSLADSQVLLGAGDLAQQAVSDQDGRLDVLSLSGREHMTVTVEQLPAAGGAPPRVLYRHDYQGSSYGGHLVRVYLTADPSGRFLLLGLESDTSRLPNQVGLIDHNSLRLLKVGKDDAELVPDAW